MRVERDGGEGYTFYQSLVSFKQLTKGSQIPIAYWLSWLVDKRFRCGFAKEIRQLGSHHTSGVNEVERHSMRGTPDVMCSSSLSTVTNAVGNWAA